MREVIHDHTAGDPAREDVVWTYLSPPEIAEQLNVAERTVKTYRARAIEKLGFSSRAEITAYVRRTGLAD